MEQFRKLYQTVPEWKTWNGNRTYTALCCSSRCGTVLLGMALALILNADIRFSRFVRSIMMAPWVVPTIISDLIWMWLYQPQYGLLKYLISLCTGGNVTGFCNFE